MLRCFAAVAHRRNLAHAAEDLGRTVSAVSMMLKQFEDHVGSALFESSRKSRLTPLGQMIFQEAQRELAQFDRSIAVIEGLAKPRLGRIRVSVAPSVASTVLPPILSRFVEQVPGVQIDIRDMDSGSIARALDNNEADVGIGTLPELDGFDRSPLFSDGFGVVCHRDHDLAKNWDQLTWRDMGDQVFIANGLCDLISDPDFKPILENSRLMVPNTMSLLGLVRAGLGITVLPELATRGASHDLVFLPLLDATARRQVHIASRPERQALPSVWAFRRLVQDKVALDRP